MVKIGVLWKAKEESKAVLTGKIGDANLLVFKNKFKEKGSKQPDYVVYVATPRKKEQEEVQEEVPESDEEELPF